MPPNPLPSVAPIPAPTGPPKIAPPTVPKAVRIEVKTPDLRCFACSSCCLLIASSYRLNITA